LKTHDDKIENVVNSSKMDIPMLEWIDEDSKAENFTLVLSKIKKKKKTNSYESGKSSEGGDVRRSKRTAPQIGSGIYKLGVYDDMSILELQRA
jgi:hypothetical protein